MTRRVSAVGPIAMTVYKKTMKGVEEIALKTTGLAPRLRPYLLLADGKRSIEQLQKSEVALPQMDLVFEMLVEQGYLKLVEGAMQSANVVQLSELRVGNGAPAANPSTFETNADGSFMETASPVGLPAYVAKTAPATGAPELEVIKQSMVRDVVQALGKDAAQVAVKIQGCKTATDLFVTMMGVKKIITMYAGAPAAEKFELRYRHLSTL